ncbi:MAG: redoxin domain-containing protein [Erythrobacter sp.]|uniref:redoxin domain-containing protein n=1 Tax=Erythrobacter sp. TaxID=1042 RepID=UPI00260A9FEB|nr:redoxin domain-containing protein [Erythrobacter sp.]MDJ0979719.1 redoxin domain-containing protein [Erythrobacter sp.]
MHQTLRPTAVAPELDVALAGGGRWSLADEGEGSLVMIDFYRGLHCPRCKLHIIDVKNKLARFSDRGVSVIAVSMDSRERGEAAREQWVLEGMNVGYGLTEDQARTWGLYLTDAINEREPRRFSEPAIIMVRPGSREIYSAIYGTNPFNRVHASDILEGLDAMNARNYPPRGGAL